MALQTDRFIDLTKENIHIQLKTGNQFLDITQLSHSKQIHVLERTEITVTEFQEVSIEITQDGTKNIEVQLPEIKTTFLSNDEGTQSFIIYEFGSNNYYPWSNGKYIYTITINDERYYGVLHVQSKNMTEDEFTNMHIYLEEQLSGISKRYTNLTEVIDRTLDNPSSNQLEHWLLNHLDKLISVLILIESNHVATFKKTYQVEPLPKHLDRKSIQWSITSKGSMYAGQKYYNRKYQLTSNSAENKQVKMNTLTILKALKDEKKNMVKRIRLINSKVVDLEERIEYIDGRIQMAEGRRNISREDIRKRKLSKINVGRDLKNKKEMLTTLNKKYHYYKRSLRKMHNLMHNTFWRYVTLNSSKRNIKVTNKHYLPFNKIWAEFLTIKGNMLSKEKERLNTYMMHSTSTLYEYYAFFKTMESLKSIGFKRNNQNKGLKIGLLFSEILPNTMIHFEKDNLRIDLVFDQEVTYGSRQAINNKTYFFSRSAKRKPDVRVDLYIFDNQYDEYLYKSSIIIEVKYRPLNNIYTDVGYTEEMNQLNEYRAIRRYCPHKETYIDGVENVICIYPGDNRDIYFTSEAGTYLTLRPNRGDEFQEYLEREILRWIE